MLKVEAVRLSKPWCQSTRLQYRNPEIHNINTHRPDTHNFIHAKRYHSTVSYTWSWRQS